jgi:hypothetical protein
MDVGLAGPVGTQLSSWALSSGNRVHIAQVLQNLLATLLPTLSDRANTQEGCLPSCCYTTESLQVCTVWLALYMPRAAAFESLSTFWACTVAMLCNCVELYARNAFTKRVAEQAPQTQPAAEQ